VEGDGFMYPAVCGAPVGSMGVYRIPLADLPDIPTRRLAVLPARCLLLASAGCGPVYVEPDRPQPQLAVIDHGHASHQGASVGGNRWQAWIVDKTTGAVVAGRRP
jgi:hypothetical protein